MSDAVILPYRVIRLFMMSFVNDPIYPVKSLCRGNVYVMSTDLSTIFFSAASML